MFGDECCSSGVKSGVKSGYSRFPLGGYNSGASVKRGDDSGGYNSGDSQRFGDKGGYRSGESVSRGDIGI